MQNLPSNGQLAVRCDIIVGTRPEAIKLAPVIKALRESGDDFKVRVVTSGQHGEICRSALAAFGLTADSELDIEPISGSLADAAGNLLRAFGRRFAETQPDLILVQGDTTTAMTAALAGFYAQVPVVHVEAGLRSGDLAHPFPEEANRQIIDAVSEILLPPTPQAQSNLSRAGFACERCPVTGNTVVDQGDDAAHSGLGPCPAIDPRPRRRGAPTSNPSRPAAGAAQNQKKHAAGTSAQRDRQMTGILDDEAADLRRAHAELQRRLDECCAERDAATTREAALAEVLDVINRSPGNLAPVFDAMLEKALRLCEAAHGPKWRIEGEYADAVALRGDAQFIEAMRREGGRAELASERPLGRVARGERGAHMPDATKEKG